MVENRSGSERLKKLEPIHERAALLLMQRGSMQAVATELGVAYDTVGNWKRSPKFQKYYRKLRRESHDEAIAVLQAANLKAVAKLIEAIDWDTTKDRPDLALQAVRMILESNVKWADSVDIPARLEALERKAKKREVD